MYGIAQLALLLLGTIVGWCCLTMFVLGIDSARAKRRAQRNYVSIEAVVLSQRLSDEHDGFYEPKIEYEYVVDGVTYKSNNVWAGCSDYGLNLKKARQILSQFPEGQNVQAFHDPVDPSQAFLIRNPPIVVEIASHAVSVACGIALVVIFSIAWANGMIWELLGVHFLVLILGGGWFAWTMRRERKINK